jgi:hypothetical protein
VPEDEDVSMIGDEPKSPVVPFSGILRDALDKAISEFNLQVDCELLKSVDEVLTDGKQLVHIIEQKLFDIALSSVSERDSRLLLARRKRYTGEWLLAVPNSWNKNLRFNSSHFKNLLSFYMCSRSPVRPCARVTCHLMVDDSRDHALLCPGREMNGRSKLVTNVLACYFRKVGTVKLEESSGFNQERPGDIAVTWSTATNEPETIYIDVSVTHMHIKNANDDYSSNHLEKSGTAKRLKYFGTVPGRFIPFNLSSTGELSLAAWNLIDELVTKLKVSHTKPGIKRDIMRNINCALQRGNAIMLCTH